MSAINQPGNKFSGKHYPIIGVPYYSNELSSEDYIVDEKTRDEAMGCIEELNDIYNISHFCRNFNLSQYIYLSCLSHLQNKPTYSFQEKDELNLIDEFFNEYESDIKPKNKRIYHNPLSCLYIAYKYGHKKAISVIADFFEHKNKTAKDLVEKLRSCLN